MLILLINGPNLNLLGQRDSTLYGTHTLKDIEEAVRSRALDLNAEVDVFQSNHEGALIDYIQTMGVGSDGVIINPGALTHYGLSLRDALVDLGQPTVEVHLSNIAGREEWRAKSVISAVSVGYITGLGWNSYVYALDFLVGHLKGG